MQSSIWQKCVARLENELTSQDFNAWVMPLQAVEKDSTIQLLAPNQFVLDWVQDKLIIRINELADTVSDGAIPNVSIQIGSTRQATENINIGQTVSIAPDKNKLFQRKNDLSNVKYVSNINKDHVFDKFVEGKSNQLAKAASQQIAESPGGAYNPLFIYGGVGLGKTHLMHAIGNLIIKNNPDAKVVYLHSERFVQDMVKALQHNAIDDFKRYYRSVNALLIDDIQFFARKERSQEEFFHTFNALMEGQQQIVLTCDRYPKEVSGLEERLKSRFGWGLTVAIEPPELETRVAILMSKAAQLKVDMPHEVAFFIAKRIRSNIRELEGALRRVIAN